MMTDNIITQCEDGCLLKIRVSTGKHGFSIQKDNNVLKVFVTEKPEKGKANQEIIKEFEKLFGKPVSILSGFKTKRKIVKVKGAFKEDILNKS